MFRWYVMQSKPRKEILLWSQLSLRKVETFFPRISPSKPPTQNKSEVPFFPGYLFIHVDFDHLEQSTLKWLPGAAGIVMFGGEPGIVPEEFIRKIKVHIDHANQLGDEGTENLHPGDPVIVQNSLLNGYPAIFDSYVSGKTRVRILLTLIQNDQRKFELPSEQIYRECR